jgi:hypothetical protein
MVLASVRRLGVRDADRYALAYASIPMGIWRAVSGRPTSGSKQPTARRFEVRRRRIGPAWVRPVTRRRFPPPWSVETTDACFIVRDRNRQALTYVYFEEEPGRRAAAKLLSRDEARRIALSIAKLPELLRRDG